MSSFQLFNLQMPNQKLHPQVKLNSPYLHPNEYRSSLVKVLVLFPIRDTNTVLYSIQN